MNAIHVSTVYSETGWFKFEKGLLYCLISILAGIRINGLLTDWTTASLKAVLPVLATVLICALFWLLEKQLRLAAYERKLNYHAALIGFFALYGVALLTDTKKSILWLILFVFFFLGIRGMLVQKTSRRIASDATLLAVFFSIACLLGHELSHHDAIILWNTTDYSVDEKALQVLSFGGLLVFFSVGMNALLGKLVDSSYQTTGSEGDTKEYLSYAAGILLFWCPYYVAFYPGILDKDSLSEVAQQLGIETLSNHHPIMHQLVIGGCLKLGKLFGSVSLGVGIYTALQAVFMACVFALCMIRLRKYGAGKKVMIPVFLFYAAFTVNGFFAVTMLKDVLFGGLTLLLIILLLEMFCGLEKRWRKFPLLLLVAFLFSTMRNNGYYAFILGAGAMFLLCRKHRKMLFVLLVALISLVTVYHHILFDVLEIKKSRTAEALSVPLQQIARTIVYADVDLEDESFLVLQEVFPDIEELRADYISVISDGVKHENVFESEVFDADPVRYLRAWARVGIQYPKAYIEAFLLQNYGYWYPDIDYPIIYPRLYDNELGLEANYQFTALRENMIKWNAIISRMEPTSVLYSVGLMVWLMLLSGTVLLLKKQYAVCYPLLLLFALWLTTLASPVYCEYRYIYGLIICVPLYLALAVMLPCRQREQVSTDAIGESLKEKIK